MPGLNISERDSPLHVACINKNVPKARRLLKGGRDPNQKVSGGVTPLMIVTRSKHLELAKLLVKHGANVSLADDEGVSSVYSAALAGNFAMVSFLIQNGADLKQRVVTSGKTLLMGAVLGGSVEVVDLLLKHGADLDLVDKRGFHPLVTAAQEGYLEIARLLVLNGADLNQDEGTGQTALITAASNGRSAVVDLLLSHGADINKVDIDGFSALLFAAQNGHFETAKLLVDRGANVDQRQFLDRSTPLACCCSMHGNLAIATVLVKAGADVNIANKFGASPLMVAAQEGRIELVKLLLQNGAQVALKCQKNDYTSLHYAVMRGHVQIADLLIQHDEAGLNAVAVPGITPLMFAVSYRQTEMIQLLLDKGANPEQEDSKVGHSILMHAAIMGKHAIAKQIMRHQKVDVDRADGDGSTPLMLATEKRHFDIAKLLLENGADVSKVNALGQTPLMMSAYKPVRRILQLLLQHKADVNQQDKHGFSALMFAAQEGHADIVELLAQAGAELGQKDNSPFQRDALEISIQFGHRKVVELFLKQGAQVSQHTLHIAETLATEGMVSFCKTLLTSIPEQGDRVPSCGTWSPSQIASVKRKRTVEANVATWDIVKEEEAEDIRARNFDFNPRAMIHEFDPRVMDLNMIQAMQSMSGNFGW